jgi:hypothetical protein
MTELMERARWIVERGLHRPPEHEIKRQPVLELPLPMPAAWARKESPLMSPRSPLG